MDSLSFFRFGAGMVALLAASLAVPGAFGADAGQQHAQAKLLEEARFPCTNCFAGESRYYYCFAVDHDILVAYQKTRVLNFIDSSKNYLTWVDPKWQTWNPAGQTIPIRYDEKHIWVERTVEAPHGFWAHLKGMGIFSGSGRKPVRLTRSSVRDIFTQNDQCRGSDVPKTR